MLPVRWSILFVVACALLWPLSAIALPPEVPGINCINNRDDDRSNLYDVADPNCLAVANLVDVGDGYAVQGEYLLRTGDSEVTLDASADGGAYVAAISGGRPYGDQRAAFGMAAGDYYLFLRVQILSPTAAEIFVKAGGAPFPIFRPDVRDGSVLNNRQTTSGWTWVGPIGRYDTVAAAGEKINTTPERTLTFATGDALWLVAPPGLLVDCVYLRPVASTESPQCPEGSNPNPIPADFIAKELGANVANINGVEDAYWPQANAMDFKFDNGMTATGVSVRMAWDSAATDRLMLIGKMTKAGLISSATANDQAAILQATHLEVAFRLADLTRVRDDKTYKAGCDMNGRKYDKNDLDGVTNTAFDLTNFSCAATYAANNLVIEMAFDLPQDVAASDTFLFDVAIMERVSGSAAVWKTAFTTSGSNIEPTQWGTGEFSSTIMEVPADTTQPTIASTAESNITETGGTITVTGSDNASLTIASRVRYGTANGGPYPNVSGPLNTTGDCTVSCSAQHSLAGLLSPGTTYYYVAEWTDQAGQIRTSAQDSLTTSAASGTTRYVNTTGSGTTCSIGTPCTFATARNASIPGDTIILRNGTYTHAANGQFLVNCSSSGGNARSGTLAARITLKAENERQAFIQGQNHSALPFHMDNCSYWTVEGLRVEWGDYDIGSNGHIAAFWNSNNLIVRRNLFRFNNRYNNGSAVSFTGTTASVIEENEVYSFHRNGLGGGNSNTHRRNYINSRAYADITGGFKSTHTGRGDGAFIYYPSYDNLVENNVSEGNAKGYDLQANGPDPTQNNRFFGNISLNDLYGVLVTARGTTEVEVPKNNSFVHFLAVGANTVGLYSRSARNTTCENCSFIGAGVQNNCIIGDQNGSDTNPERGIKPFSLFGQKMVCHQASGTGVLIDTADFDQGGSWGFQDTNSVSGTPNYNPSSSANYTGVKLSIAPNNGTSTVCPRSDSALWQASSNNEHLGASILYTYANGALGTSKLWSTSKPGPRGGSPDAGFPASTSGRYFSGCGARVAGVNDVAGSSCYDVTDRLGVTTANLNSCVGGTY